ncbi:OmpA family protein [Roseivirga pacifica]|uniref:OmpA family protein n=1 Tax=Roseivirga pacifica TaxID=1267423 RepID=UPI003BAD1973
MKKKDEVNWVSFTDLMTGLMVIFMFIAVNYIVQFIEYKFVEEDIYNSLKDEFSKEISEDEISLSPDGTITFNPPEQNLFALSSAELSSSFQASLNDFIPRYLEQITSDGKIDKIKEIRIEGHTDAIPPKANVDSYEYNLWLSSNRAQNVLKHIRSHPSYQSLSDDVKSKLEFLFTANGLSYSRALNENGNIAYLDSIKTIDNKLSRRVEFRVVTSNESLIESMYNSDKQ